MTVYRRAVIALFAGVALMASLGAPAAGVTELGAPGVTPKRIKIGIHAPFTGAAPLPSSSVERGADLFFRWLERNGIKIDGRYVDVVIRNDNYNPSQAVAVCKEMVEEDKVFMLVGIGGPYQIQACGRYAGSQGVPYVSWGASELGMQTLPRYFATSMSFEQHARLIAKLLIAKHEAKSQQNAIVFTNTPTDSGARDAFVAKMERAGAKVHLVRAVPKTAGAADAEVVSHEMQAAGIDNVFFLGRTTFWFQLEQAASNRGLNVQWAGVFGSLGTDAVVRAMCSQPGPFKAAMLSPLPAYADRDDFDRRHDKAMEAFYGERGDDTTWAGWAMGRNVAEMFRAAPRELNRRSFARKVTDATIKTGITPKLPYGEGGSFAARKTHLLRADCAARRWKTTQTFVSDF